MATLAIQKIVEAGLAPTYGAAASGGDVFPNTKGEVFLHVKNGGVGAVTVTIAPQASSFNVANKGAVTKPDAGGSVPATTGDRMFGPFPPAAFNDNQGRVAVTYSGVTTVTVAAIQLPAVV